MQTDRTTKLLLFFIAAGLWGLLLKSLFAPAPSVAQVIAPVPRTILAGQTQPITVRVVGPVPLPVREVDAADVTIQTGNVRQRQIPLPSGTIRSQIPGAADER